MNLDNWIEQSSLTAEQMLMVASSVAGQLGFQKVINSVALSVREFISHDHFDVAIISENRENLMAFESGINTDWGGTEKPIRESPIKDLFIDKLEFMETSDAQSDPRFHGPEVYSAPIFDANLRARIHIPIKISGETIGALTFSRNSTKKFLAKDISNARAVATIIGPYLHGLVLTERAETARLAVIAEGERLDDLRFDVRQLANEADRSNAEIGMDLHDQTLADLARISRSIAHDEILDGANLAKLKNDIDQCLHDLRQIVDKAKPSMLEIFGLAEALRQQLEKECASRDITPEFVEETGGSDFLVGEEVKLAFFRIGQEAINNGCKHSGAKNMRVRLSEQGSTLVLEVADDGSWRASQDEEHRGGLHNMRTRAVLINAHLEIQPSEKGTRVLVSIAPS